MNSVRRPRSAQHETGGVRTSSVRLATDFIASALTAPDAARVDVDQRVGKSPRGESDAHGEGTILASPTCAETMPDFMSDKVRALSCSRRGRRPPRAGSPFFNRRYSLPGSEICQRYEMWTQKEEDVVVSELLPLDHFLEHRGGREQFRPRPQVVLSENRSTPM